MNKNIFRYILNYYDKEVVGMISEKYGYSELEAFRKYIYSETYSMMSNMKLGNSDVRQFSVCGNVSR